MQRKTNPFDGAVGEKPIPEKVILWLTDPFIIETWGVPVPGNARIVPEDKDRSENCTLRGSNAPEPLPPLHPSRAVNP